LYNVLIGEREEERARERTLLSHKVITRHTIQQCGRPYTEGIHSRHTDSWPGSRTRVAVESHDSRIEVAVVTAA